MNALSMIRIAWGWRWTTRRELGHAPVAITGQFDAGTAAALKVFQKAHGLPQSGIYGEKTRAAMIKALRKDAAEGGPTLKEGVRGAAVKAFEAQQGWKADGVVGERIWGALGWAPAPGSPRGPRATTRARWTGASVP